MPHDVVGGLQSRGSHPDTTGHTHTEAHTDSYTQTHIHTHTMCSAASTACTPHALPAPTPPLKPLPRLVAGAQPLSSAWPLSLTPHVGPGSLSRVSLRTPPVSGSGSCWVPPRAHSGPSPAPPPTWNTTTGLGAQVTGALSRFWAWGPGMETPETWSWPFPASWAQPLPSSASFQESARCPGKDR